MSIGVKGNYGKTMYMLDELTRRVCNTLAPGSILATCPRLIVETASTQTGPFKVFRRANTLNSAFDAPSASLFRNRSAAVD
eukprot:g5895.t1